MDESLGIAVILSMFLFFMVIYWYFGPCGKNQSIHFNRIYGKFRVQYSETEFSIPLCYDVASDYQQLFGGKIIRIQKEK